MLMKRWIVAVIAVCLTAGIALAATNLVDIHKNAKANATKCVSCHSNVLKQKSSDPKVKAFHPLHLESPLLKLQCVNCHVSVDLREESGAKLRKQVDPGFCNSCHGPWPSGKTKTDAMKKMDCTLCHRDWKTKMAKASYVNLEKVTKSDCLGCHGGRVLYSGAKQEKGG